MTERISPYVLLKKSKPRIPDHQPETYDLYSQYIQDHAQPLSEKRRNDVLLSESSPPQEPTLQSVLPEETLPERKTHYVSDIHARHSKAFMRTSQSTRPLS